MGTKTTAGGKTLKVTQVRSTIGFNRKQGEIVRSSGSAASATPWS